MYKKNSQKTSPFYVIKRIAISLEDFAVRIHAVDISHRSFLSFISVESVVPTDGQRLDDMESRVRAAGYGYLRDINNSR